MRIFLRILRGPEGRMHGAEALLRAGVFLAWMITLGLPWLGVSLAAFLLAAWCWGGRRRGAPPHRKIG